MEKVRAEFLRSQPLREGIRLALLGEPNSGKSSLFNRLLGEDRSIVSQEAGTTRDVVRESFSTAGLLFRLSDTAGIRDTENAIEAKGIERSFGEASSAHLVLWVFDGTQFTGSQASLLAYRSRMNLISGLFTANVDDLPDFSISRTRHFEVLGKAVECVRQAISKVRSGEHFPDLLAADLRAALFHVGEITGEFSSDDLLNHIFAEFCIGK